MFIGFPLPRDLVSTSLTPAASSTALTPPTGYNARAWARGPEHNLGAPVLGDDFMGNGCVLEQHLYHVLLGNGVALAYGVRDASGLTKADTCVAVAIADHYHGCEPEPTAALDHLGDAVDMDNALGEVQVSGVYLLFLDSSH